MEDSYRLERLLALLLTHQMKTQRDKISVLNVAGFTNTEIADLLQTTSGVVSQVLYEARRGSKKTKGAARKKRL